MTEKKKNEELNETELDQVTGGASLGDIKPRLTEADGIRATNKAGIRAGIRAGGRAINGASIRVGKGAGVRAIKKS